jgi:hypothetical protein
VSLPALFLFEKPLSCYQTKPFFVQTALYLTDNELFEPRSINFAVRMMIPSLKIEVLPNTPHRKLQAGAGLQTFNPNFITKKSLVLKSG